MTEHRNPALTTANADPKGYADFLALDGYQTVPDACDESDGVHYVEARPVQKQAMCSQRGVLLPVGKVFEEFTFKDVLRGG